jgi:hypothetical protein
MFRFSLSCFAKKDSEATRTHRRLKAKGYFRGETYMPLRQGKEAQNQAIQHLSTTARVTPAQARRMMYPDPSQARRARGTNELYALQGLGDNASLSRTAQFGFTAVDLATFGSAQAAADNRPPPEAFTPLLARRMAEGRLWPAVRGLEDPHRAHVRELRSEENMSPSERRFAAEVEFWLRRNLRACPAHIAEHLDFTEIIIDRCFVSRRCRDLYIVWTAVHPERRDRIEPYLLRLNNWVIQTIRRRIKNQPATPFVRWIYNTGSMPTELPRKLVHELKATTAAMQTSIEDRVTFLKKLDSAEARMKGVPWFMPYLWAKDKRMREHHQMIKDHETASKKWGDAKAKAEKQMGALPKYNA